MVICNARSNESLRLAAYYMEKRAIPASNLLKVKIQEDETCSREGYEAHILRPARAHIETLSRKRAIKCLLTMYGLPLKIEGPAPTDDEARQLEQLSETKKELEKRLSLAGEANGAVAEEIERELRDIDARLKASGADSKRAALDSELALVMVEDYPLAGWVANPLFAGFAGREGLVDWLQVKQVARLDGSSPEVVQRMIDDSLAAEKSGLKGMAYFDARWAFDSKKGEGAYGLYDKSIHRAAMRVRESGRLGVVIDSEERLFQKNECPETALYCGWYSLGRYVPAFKWQKGSVGFHIASAECATLKRPGSQVWCKRMLEEGAAATIGPVWEPYLQAFPLPEIFFGMLVSGRWSLVECYFASLPYLSWQMVLVGDPLYRPF
ncbi:TIGR03790 family protein [Desulfatitalea tepidiphila]|uniref:TIGR03790 family protein n=1 Tax=Desulfatitalea tepidiphila TaxID=1185843 RepID=UPI001F4896FA|nr:TIGR03790 family protein [Desulfatitalea tepidiphila]